MFETMVEFVIGVAVLAPMAILLSNSELRSVRIRTDQRQRARED
ncbi:hypothetical protein FHW03_004011 [Ochrobactrum sp. RH2CCR150]|nr:hypothetical protein [Ochrobactrum sp. RH2CCR150]